MNTRADVKQTAFSVWLRTGRWPRVEPAVPQRKFNHNHDPANGRFTFAGGGGSFGGGGASGRPDSPAPQAIRPHALTPTPRAGATPAASPARGAAPRVAKPSLRHVVANGYDYGIDEQGRTRSVSGALTFNLDQRRSRSAQSAAGGVDRRSTDDGGHYIARRFDGPTEAFNHFAQDANFNRGDYRALENQWAAAKRASKLVTVRIAPSFEGTSKRPSKLNIWFTINGSQESFQLPNKPRRKGPS